MNSHIRLYKSSDITDLIQVTLLAFEPIFVSFEQILGPIIYPSVYPDWRLIQRETIESISRNEKIALWVAEAEGKVIGYVAYELNEKEKTGEVQLLAVHPKYQSQGIGTALNKFALQKMRESGIKMAVVGTGGDKSHAPARKSYEKAGYTALPLVRYYQHL